MLNAEVSGQAWELSTLQEADAVAEAGRTDCTQPSLQYVHLDDLVFQQFRSGGRLPAEPDPGQMFYDQRNLRGAEVAGVKPLEAIQKSSVTKIIRPHL
jgi:hypothetical protein